MGVADLRKAFNNAAGAVANCTKARLTYERANGFEYQRLEFDGFIVANSQPFTVRSDRIPPQGDLIKATSATAANLVQQQAKAKP
jgi:hypothetical protein